MLRHSNYQNCETQRNSQKTLLKCLVPVPPFTTCQKFRKVCDGLWCGIIELTSIPSLGGVCDKLYEWGKTISANMK